MLKAVTITSTDKFDSELRKSVTNKAAVPARPELNWATIDEACEKCGVKETRYMAMQTRGADEGATIMLYCVACGHRFVQTFKHAALKYLDHSADIAFRTTYNN